MKSYQSFDHWLEEQNSENQKLIKILRKLVNSCSAKLIETVKWGNGCWTANDLPVVYIYSDKKQLQLGFFAGSMLSDKKGLLQGKGKYVRFIPIENKGDIDPKGFAPLIKQAIKTKYK